MFSNHLKQEYIVIIFQLKIISFKGNSETYGGGKPPIQYAPAEEKVIQKAKATTPKKEIVILVYV